MRHEIGHAQVASHLRSEQRHHLCLRLKPPLLVFVLLGSLRGLTAGLGREERPPAGHELQADDQGERGGQRGGEGEQNAFEHPTSLKESSAL